MIKVLFIAPFKSPHILRWYDYFDKSELIKARLIICDEYINKRSLLLKIICIFTIKKKIMKLIRQFKPDILNFHTLLFPNYLLVKQFTGKIVITPWNGDVLWYRYGKHFFIIRHLKKIATNLKERQIKQCFDNANLITYNSIMMKKKILSLVKSEIQLKYFQVPGVDTLKWVKSDNKYELRQHLGLPYKKHIILSMRSLGKSYNIDVIIDALKIIIKTNKNILLVIIYPNKDNNYLKDIKKKILDYGIETNIKIVGNLKYEKVLQYYQASDVGISISSRDASPQSVLEGMSVGIPMIVGDIPELNELITHNYNGVFVPCRNKKILADNIMCLISNKELVNKICMNARECVLNKYDYYVNMENILQLFLKM